MPIHTYRRERWSEPVPVRFFAGTVRQAVAEAGRLNSQAKLTMSLKDRNNLAWRLVNCPGFSKAQIVQAASVSDGQVAVMRRAKRALGEAAADYSSWAEAYDAHRGSAKDWDADDIEGWKMERAREMAERLRKALGSKPVSNPEVFAMALEVLFDDRIGELVCYLPASGLDLELDAEADF